MSNTEKLYSQVIGPVKPEIEVGSPVQYPPDTYKEYYSEDKMSIPWGWIIFFLVFIGALVGGFLYVKKKLVKKDRDEKSMEGVLMEVRVPRNNETEIGVAE